MPDFYQGTELWDFSLVDPDNRRPVDYGRRKALLEEIDEASRADRLALASQLTGAIRDDRLKLYTTTTMLRFRRDHRQLFESGSYEPLAFEGARRDHLFGFARRHGGEQALIIVPRLVATLMPAFDAPPLGERTWDETRIALDGVGHDTRPHYRNVFTGRCVATHQEEGRSFMRAAEVFEHFPVALLYLAMFWTIVGFAFITWFVLVLLFTPRIDYQVTTPLRPDSDDFLEKLVGPVCWILERQQ